MRIASNKLVDIHRFFRNELTENYSVEEIDLLFFLCAEKFSNKKRSDLAISGQESVAESTLLKYSFAVKELKAHRPIQYILGEAPFFGNTFKVNGSVLIPRPETEELVDLIIRQFGSTNGRLLDIGTGSGCIAISLKKNMPAWEVTAMDVSADALELATENAKSIQTEILFLKDSVLEPTLNYAKPFDLIVSNPPYITLEESEKMDAVVLEYEPHLALFVTNNDPLQFYKAILKFAEVHLHSGGWLYLETSSLYANETQKILLDASYKNVELIKDISNNNRILRGQKP